MVKGISQRGRKKGNRIECLQCSRPFYSEGSHHRHCTVCLNNIKNRTQAYPESYTNVKPMIDKSKLTDIEKWKAL